MDSANCEAQSPVPYCDVHEEEILDTYCHTCAKSICTDCVKAWHLSHNWDKLGKVARKFRQRIPSLCSDITSNYISKILDALKTLQEKKKSNHETKELDIKKMNEKRQALHTIIDKLVDVEMRTLQNAAKEKNEKICEFEKDLVEKKKALEETTKHLSEAKDRLSDAGLVQLKIDTEQKLGQMESSEITECVLFDYITTYQEGEINPAQLKLMFGKLSHDPNNIIVEEVKTFIHGKGHIIYMFPISEDQCWVHNYDSLKNQLINNQGKVVTDQNYDLCIPKFVVTKNNDHFFTDFRRHCIRKINAKDYSGDIESVHTIMSTAPLKPDGICLTSDGDILVTLMEGGHFDLKPESRRLVQRISMKGEVLNTYEFDSDGTTRLFSWPARLTENNNGDVCVVDYTSSRSGRLCVLQSNGKIRFIYEGQNLKSAFCAHDVVCDPNGNIIVCDLNNHMLHLLNSTGKFIKYLSSATGGLAFPRTLGFYTSALWVGCNDGRICVLRYGSKNFDTS